MDWIIPRLVRIERVIRPRYWPFWRRRGDRIIGAAGALLLGETLRTLLFNVAHTDVLTYGLVAVAFVAVALVACALPARRAAGVDPMVALRGE
jgi:hypothetical protein